jgi:ferredoxin
MPKIRFEFEENIEPLTVEIDKGENILEVALDNDIHLSQNV